jgi:hypothetical protein
MNYAAWNILIAKHFFNPGRAGREVLIYVTDDLLLQIGSPYGIGPDDFVSSIKAETPSRDICKYALKISNDWRINGAQFPPYIGLMGFLVLSDVTEGDFVGQAYYPRLWTRLGESPDLGAPTHFDKMLEIWDDLEKWSRNDKGEELGRFVARIRGQRLNVGLVRSQTLLAESEKVGLPAVFSEAGLEPGDPPNPAALLAAVKRSRQMGSFYHRTIRLLVDNDAPAELRDGLAAVLEEELEDWDGTLPGETETPRTKQSLRLVIEETGGPFEGPLKARLRIKSRVPYPEDALVFSSGGRKWTCQEQIGGWSTPLEAVDRQMPLFLPPDQRTWEGTAKLLDEGAHWGARQSPRDVRIFYRNQFDVPLPGWVEAQRLDAAKEILIAAGPQHAGNLEAWGSKACQGFKSIETTGMPAGWKLFKTERVLSSHPDLPMLTLPKRLRVKLKGGIKPHRGNTYLAFAPPYIWVEVGEAGSEVQVAVDGRHLIAMAGQSGIFQLPSGLALGNAFQVTAIAGGESAGLVFKLVAPELADLQRSCPNRTQDGQITDAETAAITAGQAASGTNVPFSRPAWTTLLQSFPGSVLVGRRPGDIWKVGETASPSWVPIWAVIAHPHGRAGAVFCPEVLDAGKEPELDARVADLRSLAAWKNCLWNNRKTTEAPQHGGAKKLWERYVKGAKNV